MGILITPAIFDQTDLFWKVLLNTKKEIPFY